PACDVPEQGRLAARGERAAVRGKHEGTDEGLVTAEANDLLAGGGFPQRHAVLVGGGEVVAVGRKPEGLRLVGRDPELPARLAGESIPEVNNTAAAAGGQGAAVGGEDDLPGLDRALADLEALFPAGDVPDPERAVVAGGRQRLAVGREGESGNAVMVGHP